MNIQTYSKILAPVVFLVLTFLVPLYTLKIDVGTFLTIFSLIFTILVGFFIAAATSNYLRLQSLVSQEDAGLISIFNLCKIIQPSKLEQVTKAIDEYAVASLNYKIEDYVDRTEQEFNYLTEVVSGIDPHNEKGLALIQTLHEELNQTLELRQESVLASRTIVSRDHWIILILLAFAVDVLLFTLRSGDILSDFLVTIMMTATFLILILIYEVDTNRFLEEKISYQGTQRVFKVIGTLKYFPEEAIKEKIVHVPKEKYRVGVLNGSSERKLQVVE